MNDKVLMCIVASLLAAPVGVSANKVANDVLAVQKAQQTIYQIKGMVTDSNGDPLPGVTVSVKSIDRICLTDINGRYALPVPKNGVYELEFRMIGMRMVSYRITVHGSTQMKTIQLDDDISELNEVVVTGYGNIKKGAYTGSASVMSVEKQKDLPVISLAQMMEGNLSGVAISTGNGTPGANSTMRIRGIGSLSASNEPLYVLDGVPIMSGNFSSNGMNSGGFGILSTLNPSDIENVTILKDAASASLYGARGANGVVLITTKKAAQGKTTYNLKASFGISDMAYRYRPTMGGEERRNLVLEGFVNANIDAGQTVEWAEEHAEEIIDNYAPRPAGGYADWQKALFRKALQQNYDFSVMSGRENTRFAASVNYTNQESVARNSGFERYSGHLNVNNKYKNFDLALSGIFSLTKEKPLPGAQYYSNPMHALKFALTPSVPIYNEDGSYNKSVKELNYMNLVEENEINTHRSRIARTFASAEAGYTILKGLRLSTVFNVDYINTNEFRYFSPESADGRSPNGQGDFYRVENLTYNSNTRLNYAAKFGEHSVDVLAAYEIHSWDKDYAFAEAKNYATDKKNVLNVASTPVEIGNPKIRNYHPIHD